MGTNSVISEGVYFIRFSIRKLYRTRVCSVYILGKPPYAGYVYFAFNIRALLCRSLARFVKNKERSSIFSGIFSFFMFCGFGIARRRSLPRLAKFYVTDGLRQPVRNYQCFCPTKEQTGILASKFSLNYSHIVDSLVFILNF